MKIQIPEKANEIIATLAEAGYEAYVVGGCVRDAILDGRRRTGISPPTPDRSR